MAGLDLFRVPRTHRLRGGRVFDLTERVPLSILSHSITQVLRRVNSRRCSVFAVSFVLLAAAYNVATRTFPSRPGTIPSGGQEPGSVYERTVHLHDGGSP
jgi:hypothetical protein